MKTCQYGGNQTCFCTEERREEKRSSWTEEGRELEEQREKAVHDQEGGEGRGGNLGGPGGGIGY
jgi:hypothetical protein